MLLIYQHILYPNHLLFYLMLCRFGTRDDELAVLANALSAHHANEGAEGKLRAQWFLQRVADFDIANAAHEADQGAASSSSSGDRATRLRQLYRDAALIPYRLSTLEQETRQAEQVKRTTGVIYRTRLFLSFFSLQCSSFSFV